MLKDQRLTYIDPARLGRHRETLKGSMALKAYDLPPEVVPNQEASVEYEIQFDIDAEQYVFLKGKIKAVALLECQRCLQPLEHEINTEFCLSPIQDVESVDKLPERYEAVLLEQEGKISLLRLLEEELVLNLPLAALHEHCF